MHCIVLIYIIYSGLVSGGGYIFGTPRIGDSQEYELLPDGHAHEHCVTIGYSTLIH